MVFYYDTEFACNRRIPENRHEADFVLCEARYEVDLWFFRKRRVLLCGCWCYCDEAQIYGYHGEIAQFAQIAQ